MVDCPRCEEMLEPPGIPSCSECGYDLSQLPDADAGDMDRTFRITVPVNAESLSPGEIQSELQNIDPYEFEQFVADLWENLGWQTEVRQASGDAGVDVIATKDHPYPQKSVIQAKRYSDSTKVGGPEIQQYASLRQQVANVDTVIIVTTSSFTSGAKSRADDLNVKLINGRKIVDMLENSDVYEIVDEYIDNRRWVKKKVPNQESSTKAGTEEETRREEQTASVRPKSATQAAGEKNTETESSESDSQTAKTTPDSNDHWLDHNYIEYDEDPERYLAGHWIVSFLSLSGLFAFFALNSVRWYFICLVAAILSMYMDMFMIKQEHEWNIPQYQGVVYIFGLSLFFTTLPVYLVHRFQFMSYRR